MGLHADLILLEADPSFDATTMPERFGLGPHRLGLDRTLDELLGRGEWAVGRLPVRDGKALVVALAPGFAAELIFEPDEVRDDVLRSMRADGGRALIISLSEATGGSGFAWFDGERVRRRGGSPDDEVLIDEGDATDAEPAPDAALDAGAVLDLTAAFNGLRLDLDDEILHRTIFTELLPPELDGGDPRDRLRVDPDTDVDAAAREWNKVLLVIVVVFAVLIAMFLAVR